jgi:flavin reductase (DIM6/NTAB) family NADH-FMN oxidoreductase RutF
MKPTTSGAPSLSAERHPTGQQAPEQPGADHAALDLRLKRVLRYLPAPVGIVTSADPDSGVPVGLAMSAIMPVSLEPCAMAIAVNRAGASHDAIVRTGRFCINLLDTARQEHLLPFANPAARDLRFTQSDWNRNGTIWYIDGSPANIFCEIRQRVPYGTHDLLIGEVYDLISSGGGDILGWANGALGQLIALDKTPD